MCVFVVLLFDCFGYLDIWVVWVVECLVVGSAGWFRLLQCSSLTFACLFVGWFWWLVVCSIEWLVVWLGGSAAGLFSC